MPDGQNRYYEEHREERRAYARCYYERNREAILADKCRYRKEHREEILARQQRWREENPDYHDHYRAKNREERRAYSRRWQRENPEKYAAKQARRRARKKSLPDTLSGEQAKEKLSLLPCFYCGKDTSLTLDHFVGLASGGNVACGTTLANSVVACGACNSWKGAKLPQAILVQKPLLGQGIA